MTPQQNIIVEVIEKSNWNWIGIISSIIVTVVGGFIIEKFIKNRSKK